MTLDIRIIRSMYRKGSFSIMQIYNLAREKGITEEDFFNITGCKYEDFEKEKNIQ